ncbi:M24 family metallopeptidase [Gudongella sp. DL1XJH-153]|uniref:M24 family metallopeptidase n=1 Tax=Gudongella sp. DL1XJH-153 TaxID=3409804 RepID=UPI003BB6EBE6
MRTPDYELEKRIQSLRVVMSDKGIDVFITGAGAQIDQRGIVRYFLDYYIPVFAEYMVIPLKGPVTMIPHDYAGARYAETSPAIEDIIPLPSGVSPAKFVADVVKKYSQKSVAIANLDGLSYNFAKDLMSELSGMEVIDINDDIDKIREIKSEFEIKQTILTTKINEDSFFALLKEVKPGVYDIDAIQKARAATELMGVEDQYWMIGTQQGAGFWIDAKDKPTMWKEKDLIVGVTEHSYAGGHWGEVANLISIGEPDKEIIEVQKALAIVQKEAAKAIKPGNTIGQMADRAQQVLEELGYSEKYTADSPVRYFGHSQGLDVFEQPIIMSGETKLMEKGMRLNFHPSASMRDGRKFSYCVNYYVTESAGVRLTNLSDEIYIV